MGRPLGEQLGGVMRQPLRLGDELLLLRRRRLGDELLLLRRRLLGVELLIRRPLDGDECAATGIPLRAPDGGLDDGGLHGVASRLVAEPDLAACLLVAPALKRVGGNCLVWPQGRQERLHRLLLRWRRHLIELQRRILVGVRHRDRLLLLLLVHVVVVHVCPVEGGFVGGVLLCRGMSMASCLGEGGP